MNELDKLRPEVQRAFLRADRWKRGDRSWEIIRAELLRLATTEADALIALDCEHDWQVEHERAEKAEAELAALKARIADAPSTHAYLSSIGTSRHAGVESRDLPEAWVGKRVRLVVEDDL